MSTRVIRGDFCPVFLPVASSQAVEVGDQVAQVSGTTVRASDTAWASAVATPSAPTVTDTAVAVGSGLAAAATGVKVAFQFPWGEGPLSPAATATPTLNAQIKVAAIALPAPATRVNYYVETSAGSGTYKLAGYGYGEQKLISCYGNGQVPYAGNPAAYQAAGVTSGALDVTQYNFAQAYAGVSGQRAVANGNPQVYGNSQASPARVRVGTDGVYEFDCASASFKAGDLVGPAKDTGNALLNQTVVAVAGEALATGRVAEDVTSSTRVRVRVLSKLYPGARVN